MRVHSRQGVRSQPVMKAGPVGQGRGRFVFEGAGVGVMVIGPGAGATDGVVAGETAGAVPRTAAGAAGAVGLAALSDDDSKRARELFGKVALSSMR